MQIQTDCEELVRQIVSRIVTKPESVVVDSVILDGKPTIRVQVHPNDMGQVIGPQGHTVNSIRTILGAASMRDKTKVGLEIVAANSTRLRAR
jgi:hypothetical protein